MAVNQTLKVSYQYINWILATNRGIMGHLYQFTSASGVLDYFTDLDQDVSWNNQTWKSGSLRFEGLQRKLSVGLNVDEQDVKIWASPTDTLFGAAFLENAQQGLLDGAVIVRYRIVWPFVTGNAANDMLLAPLACWALCTGYTAAITKGTATHIELKVKSPLVKLDVNMPRNYYQPGCNWVLFSQNCTLSAGTYAVSGTVATGVTPIIIPVSGGITIPAAADGLANFAQGRLTFTSGINTGLLVLINNNDSNNLYLAYPLNNLPNVGDTFTYTPGCSKAYSTCSLKFNNTANFRGFDKVPPVMISI